MTEKVYIIGIILILTVLWGCQDQEQTESTGDPVTANLAFSVSHASGRETRLTNAVVQETGYRGLKVLGMIPFAISGDEDEVSRTDRPLRLLSEATSTSYPKSGNYGAFYLFQSYIMMRGTNAFLVYGKAPDATPPSGVSSKAYYGSLVAPEPTGFINPDLNTLSFCPDPIHDDTAAPVEAQLLAGYLTSIANATTEGGVTWGKTKDPILKEQFLDFIGLQTDGNMLMAGSSANIIAYINAWYEDIYRLDVSEQSPLTDEGKALKTAILARIQENPYTMTIGEGENEKTYQLILNASDTGNDWELSGFKKKEGDLEEVSINYPASMGLPDGAAALRWAKKTTTEEEEYEFIPQTQTTPMDNINSINRYCYPAELYYYVNSRIDTSDGQVTTADYAGADQWEEGDNSGNSVLKKYEHKKGSVTGSTQSVAIQKPLQYAVGRLKMSMQAETTYQNGNGDWCLQDAKKEKWVPLTKNATNSFPLTGMIVGNQHPVGFDFKPLLDGNGQETHVDDSFIYDSQMQNETSSASYYYLTTTKETIPSTLVLQSYDGEEVIIMLEFRNNSGEKFNGVNGVIYPGTKFYLVGKINPSDVKNPANVPEEVKGRVFTQDYVTTVDTKVKSLENAYSVMPDILGGRLEIGVQLTTDWIQATTTHVIMR